MDVSRNKQLAGAGQVCPRAPWIPHICSFHQMMKMIAGSLGMRIFGEGGATRCAWLARGNPALSQVLLASTLVASPLLLSRLATKPQH